MNYQCPICGTQAANEFLRRENVPVHQNFLFEIEQDAVNIARGILSIAICHYCGFVFNADFDESLLSYDEKYENTQSYSHVFEKYLDESVDYLVNKKGVKNQHVVEVGCGKGHFLQKLVEQGGNSGIGFDPSYIGPLEKLGGKLNFKRNFFDETSADLVADIIICRHVIEHIGNPLGMLGAVRRALVNSPHAQVFFETPDVAWILKNQVVWDFFYEHCSYFSRPSIRLAFEKSGFLVDEIKTIFGNQYFWIEARPTMEPRLLSLKNVDSLVELAQKFSEVNVKLLALWKEKLIKIRAHGNIAIWGAGAKGVTFANLCDPEMELISYIIDINPQKQNKYLPGTGHPIVGYHELLQKNIRSIIILNPNYRREIENLLEQSGASDMMIYEFISGVENENRY
mgnify:CR=1 FL=1